MCKCDKYKIVFPSPCGSWFRCRSIKAHTLGGGSVGDYTEEMLSVTFTKKRLCAHEEAGVTGKGL